MWSATGVEAAYARSDLFERRRQLMDDWAGYLAGPSRGPEQRSMAVRGGDSGAGGAPRSAGEPAYPM